MHSDVVKPFFHFYNVSKTIDQITYQHLLTQRPSMFLLSILFTVSVVFWMCRRNEHQPRHDRAGLRSLVSVLTPSGSFWPRTYTTLVERAKFGVIKLPLHTIIDDILAGNIQFRNPAIDLSALIGEGICVYGWRICFHAEAVWWIKATYWLVRTHAASLRYNLVTPHEMSLELLAHTFSGNYFGTSRYARTASRDRAATGLLAGYPLVSKQPSTLCLDFLPHAHLEPFIRHLQSTLRPGTSVILEFSTLASTISLFSTQFILCALAFLPRKHIHQPQRTSLPLLNSLSRVVELSSTSCSTSASFSIESLENVSEKYAMALISAVTELAEAKEVRELHVRRFGLQGWRAQKFWTEWEAAIVKAGLLERWVLTVHKKAASPSSCSTATPPHDYDMQLCF